MPAEPGKAVTQRKGPDDRSDEEFPMRAGAQGWSLDRPRPALENLSGRKPRGSGRGLWGKRDGVAGGTFGALDRWAAMDSFSAATARYLRLTNGPRRPRCGIVSGPEIGGSTEPRFPERGVGPDRGRRRRWPCHHAAAFRGGALVRGRSPRRKVSTIRIAPPQSGHGSLRVSGGTGSVSVGSD